MLIFLTTMQPLGPAISKDSGSHHWNILVKLVQNVYRISLSFFSSFKYTPRGTCVFELIVTIPSQVQTYNIATEDFLDISAVN